MSWTSFLRRLSRSLLALRRRRPSKRRPYRPEIEWLGERVLPTATTLALSVSASEQVYGQGLTLTPSLSAADDSFPSEPIALYADGSLVGNVTANDSSGTSSGSLTVFENAGSHWFSAIFAGDGVYDPSSAGASALIDPATLAVSDLTANSKSYDGSTVATLNTASATLSGVVSGDNVALDASQYSATFASANAGTGISVTVSNLGLTGTAASNYVLTQPTNLSATITPRR